jgi:hypothetical protein
MSTDYTLAYGTHASPEDGRCAMEWVSHLAGEPHSDEPACVSPVIRAFCVALNDGLDDEPRPGRRPGTRWRPPWGSSSALPSISSTGCSRWSTTHSSTPAGWP